MLYSILYQYLIFSLIYCTYMPQVFYAFYRTIDECRDTGDFGPLWSPRDLNFVTFPNYKTTFIDVLLYIYSEFSLVKNTAM